MSLPQHLNKYIVDQNYSRYTPEDQCVWRFILRHLKIFLSQHAHPCYIEGLDKTGISTESIPRIDDIDKKLQAFGWRAVPVSGFIPPAAFMEFQSLGYLPIASDMRTLEHLLYTPAPDIVHEAAGHAPILIDPDFANYLKAYAQVASHSIISSEDLNLYSLIRRLSDLKESPHSSSQDIQKLEVELENANATQSFTSEASYLGRMNWWTAEYGLFGDIKNPKIFGAGLLSSLGEARSCLNPSVTKIPLTLDCVQYSYDITKPQPQLFVTPNFDNLSLTLEELAKTMAYRIGGLYGLKKAREAKTVCSVELDSGLQISGLLETFIQNGDNADFIKFSGPTQLALNKKEIPGHSKSYHSQGYSTPLGALENINKSLLDCSKSELDRLNINIGKNIHLKYKSGIEMKALITNITYAGEKPVLIKCEQAQIRRGEDILFDPKWGTFDLGVGNQVVSVFGGAADREKYGDMEEDFIVNKVPQKSLSTEKRNEHRLFEQIFSIDSKNLDQSNIETLVKNFINSGSRNWLIATELLNLARSKDLSSPCLTDVRKILKDTTYSQDEQLCIELQAAT